MSGVATYAVRRERDVLERVEAAHANPPTILTERADLRFVSVRYPPVVVTYPALGFYAVSTRVGGAAYIHEEGWRPGRLRAAAGTTFVQAPNRMVEYGCREEHVACAMCIEPADLERAACESELLHPDRVEILSRVERDPVSAGIIAALAELAGLGNNPAQQLACDALRKAMAMHLLSRYGTVAPRRRTARSRKALSPQALKKAIAYLEDNVETCNLDALAAHAGVDSFAIGEQFRRATGQSPARYLLRVRIERAKVLLARSVRSVEQVAVSLGFSDAPAFRQLFRRSTGVSPELFSLLHGASPDLCPRSAGRLS